MGRCDITKSIASGKVASASLVADDSLRELIKPLHGRTNLEEMANMLVGFQDMVFKLEGSDAFDILNKQGKIPDSMDKMVDIYTGGAYKTLPDLIRMVGHGDDHATGHMRVLGQKALSVMEKLAIYRTDFKAGEDIDAYSDFMRLYGNLTRQATINKVATSILHPGPAKTGWTHVGNLVAKDQQLFDLDMAFTGINSAIKTNNGHVKDRLEELFKGHMMKDYVSSKELNKFMGQTDGKNYEESKVFATKMAEDLMYLDKMLSVEEANVRKGTIVDRLISFKKGYDMINYGVDLEKLDARMLAERDKIKEANPNVSTEEINQKMNAAKIAYLSNDNNVAFSKTKDGEPIAPVFWMMQTQGRRVRDIVEAKRSLGADIEPIEDRFSKAFNPDDPQFKARTYYTPSKLDDFLELGGLSNHSYAIAQYPDFFKEKQNASGGLDVEGADIMALTSENMRKFQYTIEKLSKYSVSTLQNKIIEKSYEANVVNKDMDQAYTIIKNRNDYHIKKLSADSIDKQYQYDVMVTKKFVSSFQALAAGSILMRSAANNYLGGLVSIAGSLGIGEGWRIASDYRGASRSNDDVERFTRVMVDKHLAFINPVSAKSEMLLKDITLDKDKMGMVERGFSILTDAITKAGDWMMAKGLLGSLPGLKFMAFNKSEENISKMHNAVLYDRIVQYMKTAFKDGGEMPLFDSSGRANPSREFTDTFNEALRLFESDARRKSYQAVGQYDDSSKPLIFTGVKDSQSVAGVIGGALTSMTFMFKQVELNNMHLLNRITSVFTNGKNLNPKVWGKVLKSTSTPASAASALGILAISFYEWLSEEYEYLPQAYSAFNSVPTKLPKDVAIAASGLWNVMSGDPVSAGSQQAQLDMMKFLGGPLLSGPIGDVTMQWYENNSPLSPYVKRWAKSMDIEQGYYELMSGCFGTFDNAKDMYSYQQKLKLSRSKTMGIFSDSKSGVNIPALIGVNLSPIGTGAGVSKLAQDLAIFSNSMINGLSLDNENDSDRAMKSAVNNAMQIGKDLLGISIYIPEESKNMNKYYNDYNERKLNYLIWENEYHGKNQTAGVYRTAQQQLNRLTRMPYIERPVYNQADWKYKGQPQRASQLAGNAGNQQQFNKR